MTRNRTLSCGLRPAGLRDKLKRYYELQGQASPVRLDLPKGGYAVTFELRAPAAAPPAASRAPLPVIEVPEEAPVVASAARWRRLALLLASAALLLLLVTLIAWWRWDRERLIQPLSTRIFSSLPGVESDPALAPDGSKAAFVWSGKGNSQSDIYVQSADSLSPVQVTHESSAEVSSPAWSPDGKEIAYLRDEGNKHLAIMTVDLVLRQSRRRAEVEASLYPLGPFTRLDWSPDGRHFLTTHQRNLVLISTSTGQMRVLAVAPERALGLVDGVFSPDGRTVAFRQSLSFGISDLYTVPAEGGTPARLTQLSRSISGHAWAPDGRSLVFAMGRKLWRVPLDAGPPRSLTDGALNLTRPASARRAGRLVFQSAGERSHIWRIPLHTQGAPELVRSSTMADIGPDLTADHKRLAFSSDRTGTNEIWLSRPDGSNPQQLTRFDGPLTGCPRWSPDGRRIVLDSRPDGKSDIFVIDVASGRRVQFTTNPADDVVPSWSHDGRFIYFASNRTGSWQVWKKPADGSSLAVQVTRSGGFAALESPDGKTLYYAKDRSTPGLWQVPVGGGPEREVLPELEPGLWGYWRVDAAGILFAETEAPYRLRRFDPSSGRITLLSHLPRPPLPGEAGMAPASGDWLYVALADAPAGDLFIVDQFR